jgi:hypothetical protein
MGLEQTDWGREAALVRPAKLTLALYQAAPALDASRPWVPEHLLPLYGGDGFNSLTQAQRLRYNHAYARQLIAEFIWSEGCVIVAPLERVCRTQRLDADAATVLQSFLSDERHHLASYAHLADLCARAVQQRSATVLRPPRIVRGIVAMATRFPVRLFFWAAATEAFERYTIKLGQSYHRDENVDPLFREVFVAHARDEARHCRLDALIGTWLQARAGAAWTTINARLLAKFQSAYRSVDWGLDGPLLELADAHPEIADRIPRLLAEAKSLRRVVPLPAASE